MYWRPWWPYRVEILHNSSDTNTPISLAPNCQFACNWPRREIMRTHLYPLSCWQSPEIFIRTFKYFICMHFVCHFVTFLTASFFFSFLSLFNSDFSSKISPFLVVVKYFESVILFSILLCANVSMLYRLKIELQDKSNQTINSVHQ